PAEAPRRIVPNFIELHLSRRGCCPSTCQCPSMTIDDGFEMVGSVLHGAREWGAILTARDRQRVVGDAKPECGASARLALRNIEREFPSNVWYHMQAADDMPRRLRERTPVFVDSFDWHSCVE